MRSGNLFCYKSCLKTLQISCARVFSEPIFGFVICKLLEKNRNFMFLFVFFLNNHFYYEEITGTIHFTDILDNLAMGNTLGPFVNNN